ncbi:Pdc2p KNAG_0D01810 [Huiozyma naganishii CBS 8797]|uniref:HTH CENPB-type domain-containing protein n=1 Tax=Huiozyma naganishii (strain ATCC MYA-139 / BCRC 22969 / CBS 8797 / KCTC 17520 / NBRC 10181 / NCYC 3082 / Yp74L-3) TaxID=1071383 RepID=J7RXU9_HUIN7|nr:hypothetical protein KNAG_0D01810 [Kazachstania naganishii CBS 8797]CCK69932.1 hypothetical protein KNAG_0D01810 [Kazachstania naganishii CBS 8797]
MLSVEQRYNICLMAERHPKWTQLELAKWAYETFQLDKVPSQGTISRLLAKKTTYMNCKEHEKDANRIRKPNNLLVRKILQEWISQSIWNGIPITSPIIQDTAQAIWHRIPAEHREGNGSFSYKWISNFLSKMDVNVSVLDEEMPKTPKIWTFEERASLKEIFAKVEPYNLFTLDETFLAYNLPLDYSQYETSYIQRKIEVVTVMLCSNLDGSEKSKPLVVGRFKSYASFRNYFPDDPTDMTSQSLLGEKMAKKFEISYHSNRKSWLTSNLFHNWLVRWDKRLVADNRKIYIVLDDSCSHRIINLHLKNITLVYTSANSRFLPFNWGVLDEFKTRYRIQQYKALIELQKRIETKTGKRHLISFEQSQLTMSNAFKFIKTAWEGIPVDTIKANWKSAGILPPGMIQLNENVSMAFKKNEILESELNSLCHEFCCEKQWDYDMLLDLNIENKHTNFLSTEELVESAIVDLIQLPSVTPAVSNLNSTATSQIGIDELVRSMDPPMSVTRDNALATAIVQQNTNTNQPFDMEPYDREQIRVQTLNGAGSANTMKYNENSNPNPNVNTTASSNANATPSLLDGTINGHLDPNLNKLLLDSYGQNGSNNNMYNVSTLIDKPNLFMDQTPVDLNLKDMGVDLSSTEYFNDLFTHPLQETASGTNHTNIADGELAFAALSHSGTSESNHSSVAATTTNSTSPHHTGSLGGRRSVAGGHPAVSTNNDNILLTGKGVRKPSISSGHINPTPMFPSPSEFEISNLAGLLKSNGSGDMHNDYYQLPNTTHDQATETTPQNMTYFLNSLQSNLDIAKSLGNIIKHSENNEINLSRNTLTEIQSTYVNLLKNIKNTKKQIFKAKSQSKQAQLQDILSNPDIANNIVLNSNDTNPLNANLKDNTNAFI